MAALPPPLSSNNMALNLHNVKLIILPILFILFQQPMLVTEARKLNIAVIICQHRNVGTLIPITILNGLWPS